MPKLYINRQLRLGDEIISEAELLKRSRVIIVLAEPGAGKSDLLTHMAMLLSTENVRAARFRTEAYIPTKGPLVIDAMDEVARVGESQLNDIVAKASANYKNTVVFASRSGEWEKARTKFVEECFGLEPGVAYLEAFSMEEQQHLFQSRFPGISFEKFAAEVQRFDLSPLLGNPEFIQLLGLAFLENDGRFNSKVQIYSDAARRLAQESNEGRSSRLRPDASVMVEQAGTVFARLLLSGASGISLKEKIDDRNYPYTGIVAGEVSGDLTYLLDSRLFKPTGDANEHEPVHRIVAEYLAAQYLAHRIDDPGDRLSVKRCLAIIAPNRVVRDELRGLLGWLAALGGDTVQKATIEIDPYAVLANGDPSQLLPENKLLLIESLQKFAETDPYFRRSDEWRSFNVGQFFSDETIKALRPILAGREDSHLRGLIIELFKDTQAVEKLTPDLLALVLDPIANEYERLPAINLLVDLEQFDAADIFDPLLAENSPTAMQLLTRIINKRGTTDLTLEQVAALLRRLATLYPVNGATRHRDGMSRYFIKQFFREFPTERIADYLNELTEDIQCTCNPKKAHRCECRHGISKIVGGLLDRYFEINSGPHDPARVWKWIKNLHFSRSITAEDSTSVQALSEDNDLRQAIQRIALSECTTLEECNEITSQFFLGHLHAGLRFTTDDVEVAVQLAFDQDFVPLWENLWRPHNINHQVKDPDELRAKMRAQAREKPEFMEAWAKHNHASKLWWRKHRHDWADRSKRYRQREAANKAKDFDHLRENLVEIEAGRHWGWLMTFAYHYLYEPEKLAEMVDDIETAYRALRNCFPFLAGHIPTLQQLAKYEHTQIAIVLHAACILRWRETGTLDGIETDILRAVKTESNSTKGIEEDEATAFDDELNRLLFPGEAEIKQFARDYIEPTLSGADNAPTNVNWLEYKTPFQDLGATLSLEWLQHFPDMPSVAEACLFKMVARHFSDSEVRKLIAERVEDYLPEPAADSDKNLSDRRIYWLMNSFYHDDDERVWDILKADKDTLLGIAARSGRFASDDDWGSPPLSADKLYKVLDAFVEKWPEVDLPSSYGSGDPPGETAYRFMREIPWRIGQDEPRKALVVLDKLLNDGRFASYRSNLLATRATVARKAAHMNYHAPSSAEISSMLEKRSIASVEDMRSLMVETLIEIEGQIRQAETDTLDTFYKHGEHVDENTARNRLVDLLRGYMTAQRLSVVIEHHMAQSKRCDITATEMIDGRRRLLTIEVKGQWHPELFTAAATQLDTRYSSNPDAAQQGIYLVLWFGPNVTVAGRKNNKYTNADELHAAIIETMPSDLRGRIDVQVIDLSREP